MRRVENEARDNELWRKSDEDAGLEHIFKMASTEILYRFTG